MIDANLHWTASGLPVLRTVPLILAAERLCDAVTDCAPRRLSYGIRKLADGCDEVYATMVVYNMPFYARDLNRIDPQPPFRQYSGMRNRVVTEGGLFVERVGETRCETLYDIRVERRHLRQLIRDICA